VIKHLEAFVTNPVERHSVVLPFPTHPTTPTDPHGSNGGAA
jgi:hypothetical protein